MKHFKRVYLSGGMEYAADEGRDWRREMHTWLQEYFACEVFNPNVESDKFFAQQRPGADIRKLKERDIAAYAALVAQLVAIDCREIAERSDLVICLWDDAAMRGAGTKGELTMAKYFDKPVYMVTSMPPTAIPGWVLGCTTLIFSSFEELKEFLVM